VSQIEARGNSAVRESSFGVAGLKRRWWRGRGSTLWLAAATLILPFGWILPVAQLAWIRTRARREREF
jgi:hypothetical protein